MEASKQLCLKLRQIDEVDAGHSLTDVNRLLAKGWVYLGYKKTTREGDNGTREYLTYVLGEPSE